MQEHQNANCLFCQYDLSGNPNGLCPECGRPVFRFTDRAREVMVQANRQALLLLSQGDPRQPKSPWWLPKTGVWSLIRPTHVLLGIVNGPRGIGYHALQSRGVSANNLTDSIIRQIPRDRPRTFADGARLPLSRSSSATVRLAIEEATRLQHHWVGTEHLLLALCRQPGDRIVQRVLSEANIHHEHVRAFVVANMAAINSAPKADGTTSPNEK